MDPKRPDNIDDLKDKVIAALLDAKSSPPPPCTNHEAIQKLTHNFAAFIETTGISIPHLDTALEQLRGHDAGVKLVLIKTYLVPRIGEVENLIKEQATARGIEVAPEVIAKCIRFLRALSEVAMQ